MPLFQLLFGFHGRISAAQFRQGGTIAGMIVGLLFFASACLLTTQPMLDPGAKVAALACIWGAILIFLFWANTALQVKRLHDRGRSGFLALISACVFFSWSYLMYNVGHASFLAMQDGLVADAADMFQQSADAMMWLGGLSTLVGAWVFVDLGLLPGTPGPNQFGPPPGEPGGSPVTPAGGSDSAPRRSWLAPKPSASSWDVSGAEAAIASAIAERNSRGAATGSEMWKENGKAGASNPAGQRVFGRRN